MKVLLVEDHELFRDGVTLILESLGGDIDVLWRGDTAGVKMLIEQGETLDLVLLDYNLPDGNGLDCLQAILQKYPETPTILLSAEQDSSLIQSALAAGAKGFITKTSSSKVMLSAIQLVLSGGVYVPPEMLSATTAASAPPKPAATPLGLTTAPRQHQLT